MYSIAFPDMFTGTKTDLVSDHTATAQNLLLLLKSDKSSLFGDPYFGTLLRKMLYEQNNLILQDLIVDEIYSAITTFMPQIRINRNNITLTSTGDAIYVTIQCTNLIDYQPDLYEIKLTEDDEE